MEFPIFVAEMRVNNVCNRINKMCFYSNETPILGLELLCAKELKQQNEKRSATNACTS